MTYGDARPLVDGVLVSIDQPPFDARPIGEQTAPGWYPDLDPGQLRYWDGVAWTGHTHPDAHPAPFTASPYGQPGPNAGSPYGQQFAFVAGPSIPFGVAKALRVVLLIQTIGFGILVALGLSYRSAGTAFLDDPTFQTLEELTSAEDTYLGTWGLLVFTGIAAFVLLVVWSYKTAKWAESQGASMRHSPGWAIGGWFVPFANLVIPFRVLNDLYRYSEPGLPRPIVDHHKGRPGSGFLWGWYIGFITSTVLVQWSSALLDIDGTEADFKRGLTLRAISPVISLIGVGMLLLYVGATMTRLQRAQDAAMPSAATPAGWGS